MLICCSPDSYTDVPAWVEEGQRYAVDSIMFLVGNKADVSEERVTEAAKAEVRSHPLPLPPLPRDMPATERALTKSSTTPPASTGVRQGRRDRLLHGDVGQDRQQRGRSLPGRRQEA